MNLRETAEQARTALNWAADHIPPQGDPCQCPVCVALVALEAALAQEEATGKESLQVGQEEPEAALAQLDTDCHAQGICQRSGYGIGTITPAELSAALGWPGGISEPVLDKAELLKMVANARVAQQEQEPVDDAETWLRNRYGAARGHHAWRELIEAFNAGRTAAQEQGPVAWIQPDHLQKARRAPFLCRVEPTQRCADFVPIYTHPPRREWRSLSEEEIKAIHLELCKTVGSYYRTVARAVEQALRSKNCG